MKIPRADIAIDVLVIGSGPAGTSTALHLVQIDPRWSNRMMVVDAAVHPRDKLCGGGLTRHGMEVLDRLGLALPPGHVPVRELQLKLGRHVYAIRDEPLFRVVRRNEFDHWLVQCARERGVVIQEGEKVLAVIPEEDGMVVRTSLRTIHARAVVAADGSPSFVRQQMGWTGSAQTARLMEVLSSEAACAHSACFRDGTALFEFDASGGGLQGYYWEFPCRVEGQPSINRGLYDSRTHLPGSPAGASMKEIFVRTLTGRDLDLKKGQLRGHTLRWFDAGGEFSRPGCLLVGDAAGVDPLFGEGISYALAYGDAAASELAHAFAGEDLTFAGYRRRILHHPVLRHLPRRRALARTVYALHRKPWLAGVAWRLAPWYFRWLAWRDAHAIPMARPQICRAS